MRDSAQDRAGEEDAERFEQPHPGSTGHAEEQGKPQEEEPEADGAGDPTSDGSGQVEQESKHSHPTSDPPANY